MTTNDTTYKQLFKATSIFGGVQVFNIVISIIRSKFIAILLGPEGMGIAALFNSNIGFIGALTNFGLERSAVKNIASAYGLGNKEKISIVVKVMKKLVWFTGLLGTLVTFIFSSFLSELTFGTNEYSEDFVWLSITLFINQISAGQGVILRGMHKIEYIAKSSLWGSFTGLAISTPIYYVWGIDGIVPAILLSSLFTYLITYYYTSKIYLEPIIINKENLYTDGKNMLKMGIVLSISTLLVMGESLLVRIYIRLIGSIEDVGFYNAGFAIVNTYFGVIFTAITMDYYPRLASLVKNMDKARSLMNKQSEIIILILAPILTVFLIFVNFVIIAFYSIEFIPISEMIHWAAMGIYFKAASWSLGVIFVSKGDVKTLLWTEIVAIVVTFVFNILGYKYLGLQGLGISFFLSYLYAFVQTFIVVSSKYSFCYSNGFFKIYGIQLLLGLTAFMIVKFLVQPYTYIFGIIIVLISVAYSLKQLNRRMDLIQYFDKYTKRK